MADLERAEEIVANREPKTRTLAIAQALAAARREGAELADWQRKLEREAGAEEMRERAAQLAFDRTSDDPQPGDWNEACKYVADAIRALSLTPEEPT